MQCIARATLTFKLLGPIDLRFLFLFFHGGHARPKLLGAKSWQDITYSERLRHYIGPTCIVRHYSQEDLYITGKKENLYYYN